MSAEDSTLDSEDLSSEARWSYYVTAYSMRDPTEGVQFSEMRMPFLKRSLPSKLDEDEEYDRYYRRLQHFDGLIIRICANNYTILYQPPSHDWFWRSTAPALDKDADAETVKAKEEEQAKEKAALREKRHDRFVEKFVNNPNWARGLSKDKVDESNQQFRSWLDGTLSKETPAPEESKEDKEVTEKSEPADTEMADAASEA
jgi:paired amphipathic helix protein Sin3a